METSPYARLQMSPDSTLLDRLRAAADLLELIDTDRGVLDQLPSADQERFRRAIAQVYNPDPVARRAQDQGSRAGTHGLPLPTRRRRTTRNRNPHFAAQAGIYHSQRFSSG